MGHWLVKGDRTTCGGQILEGTRKREFAGNYAALNGHKVSCGKHPGVFHVAGGHPGETVDAVHVASTLYSHSTCPCKAHFIPSQTWAWHGSYPESLAQATPAKTTSEPIQEPENHAQIAKKQNSFTDTCKVEDNVLLDGVYLWTEITGSGHVFVSVHESNNIYLYTYGRYGRVDKSTLTGEGILDFFLGEDARKYYRYELYEMGARVFRITDADPKFLRQYFEDLWDGGVPPVQTTNMQEGTKRRGHTIDKYDVTGSNCTTHSVAGIKFAGSKVFGNGYKSTTTQLPIDIEEDFTIPVSLQRYLVAKGSDFSSMLVVEMTNTFKALYPNIQNKWLQPTGGSARIQQVAADSVAVVGSTSPYSGGTVGGSLGSTYNDE